MRSRPSLLFVTTLLGLLAGGCGEAAPGSGDAAAGASSSAPSSVAPIEPSGAAAPGEAESPMCISGGTPREDVRRILGEPDSISFGAWLYGSSEIQFGYGVVLETRDPDGRLRLCD